MTTPMINTMRLLLTVLTIALLSTSCEDPIPSDYTEELVIEGFAVVDEPLANIRVMRTLPISDTFSFAKAGLSDATVRVYANDVEIVMEYVSDTLG
ncbi:MAG: hypothetical protein ACK45E_00820, partial [Ignavibacteria bacterium]